MHQSYRTDLTEQQWEILSQLIPPAQRVRATEAELPLPKGVRANARCRLRRLEAFGFAQEVVLEL